MRKTRKLNPKTQKEMLEIIRAMCHNYVFKKNQPKTPQEINEMIDSLSVFCLEAVLKRDIEIAQAQIMVLSGTVKASDYNGEKLDMKRALRAAEKWLLGKVYDEALFV